MKKQLVYPFLAVLFSLLLGACSEQTKETTGREREEKTETKENKAKEAYGTHSAHWSYQGETGPEHWGELDPLYAQCIQGKEQSPVNIESSKVKSSGELKNHSIHYVPTDFSLVHNGHTIQANAKTANNHISVEGEEYKLIQFHFHTPSEHQVNGQNYDMELHLVHKDAKGKLAVLGIMLREGKENETLASFWGALPKEETENDISVSEPIDLQGLLPKDQTSFHYNGSLTTPPCTEKVQWIVFEEPIEMSKEQIQAFQQNFPDNHRPVQLLNEREVIMQ